MAATDPSLRVGFIGLGNQGAPIAAHLAPAGITTTVFDLDRSAVNACAETGARAAESASEVGSNADIVGVCVPEDAHVRAVVLGEDGLLSGVARGAVIAIHSTIMPATAIELADEAAARGVHVIDACVTGGAQRAADRQITYLVGGDASAVERARPYFEATTDVPPVYAGELGNGAKLKLCINLITYIQWAAAFESMKLAEAIGLPQDVLEAAGRSNGQLTDLMANFLTAHKLPEDLRSSPDFQALMQGHMRIAEKDLSWALALARESGVALPVGALVSQNMARIYGVDDPKRR